MDGPSPRVGATFPGPNLLDRDEPQTLPHVNLLHAEVSIPMVDAPLWQCAGDVQAYIPAYLHQWMLLCQGELTALITEKVERWWGARHVFHLVDPGRTIYLSPRNAIFRALSLDDSVDAAECFVREIQHQVHADGGVGETNGGHLSLLVHAYVLVRCKDLERSPELDVLIREMGSKPIGRHLLYGTYTASNGTEQPNAVEITPFRYLHWDTRAGTDATGTDKSVYIRSRIFYLREQRIPLAVVECFYPWGDRFTHSWRVHNEASDAFQRLASTPPETR